MKNCRGRESEAPGSRAIPPTISVIVLECLPHWGPRFPHPDCERVGLSLGVFSAVDGWHKASLMQRQDTESSCTRAALVGVRRGWIQSHPPLSFLLWLGLRALCRSQGSTKLGNPEGHSSSEAEWFIGPLMHWTVKKRPASADRGRDSGAPEQKTGPRNRFGKFSLFSHSFLICSSFLFSLFSFPGLFSHPSSSPTKEVTKNSDSFYFYFFSVICCTSPPSPPHPGFHSHRFIIGFNSFLTKLYVNALTEKRGNQRKGLLRPW